jgi:hypothetical protein
MKKSRKLGLFILILALVGICIRVLTSPVIFHLKDPAAVDPGDGLYVMFSPVRNRAPERVGNSFFERLKVGDCGTGLTAVASDSCGAERKYAPYRWTLVDRRDSSDGKVTLQYKLYCRGYQDDSWRNAWITVARVENEWAPVSYDTYY